MVVTDIPFVRPNNIKTRYDFLRKSQEQTENQGKTEEGIDYASFLKEQEERLTSEKPANLLKGKNGVLKPIAKVSESPRVNVVKFTNDIDDAKKEHDRKMKVIEDHMWHEKREERELKRAEGDIIKNQRALRNTLREFENAITKQKLAEEKRLNQSLEKYTELQKEDLHRKEQLTHTRIQLNLMEIHAEKDAGRKAELQKNDCMRQFQAKMSELQLRRAEIDAMAREFEQKMKQQEEVEHSLKQQIAELVLVMNMNAMTEQKTVVAKRMDQKMDDLTKISDDLEAQRSLENKLLKGDIDIKAADMHKRKLSASLQQTKSLLGIRGRDEQRHLIDTQKRISDNSQTQRRLNQAARDTKSDLKGKEMDSNLQAHVLRRERIMTSSLKERKEKHDAKMTAYEAKFRKRYNEQQARVYEDNIKHLQRSVDKNEEKQQRIYKQVRSAEYSRRKQDQLVEHMVADLDEMKRTNSIKLKEMAVKIQMDEAELNQKIQRAVAELDKLHSERADCYHQLQKHRAVLKHDKHLLCEQKREQDRVRRIINTSS